MINGNSTLWVPEHTTRGQSLQPRCSNAYDPVLQPLAGKSASYPRPALARTVAF